MDVKIKPVKQVRVLIDQTLGRYSFNDRVLANSKTIAHLSSEGNKIATLSYQDRKLALPYKITEGIPDGEVRVSKLVMEALKGTTENWAVTLGCDPEFVLLNKRGLVSNASRYLAHLGEIGSDGVLAELRPTAGKHEDEVIENLRRLIKSVPEKVGNFLTPEAHSEIENNAIGFHVHLGLPRTILELPPKGAQEFFTNFIRAMDYFVGIPAMLPEDNSRRRLGNGKYGKLKDFRRNNRTIEYRTPGGFHLRHPDYARGLLGLALCVGQEIVHRYESKSNLWLKLHEVSSFSELQKELDLPIVPVITDIFNEASKNKAAKELPVIIKKLNSFSTFSEHKDSIMNFMRCTLEKKTVSPKLLDNW